MTPAFLGDSIPTSLVNRLLDLERQFEQSRSRLRAVEAKLGRTSPRFQQLLAIHNDVFTRIGRIKTDIRLGDANLGLLAGQMDALASILSRYAADLVNAVGATAEGTALGVAKIAKWAAVGAVALLGVIVIPSLIPKRST